MDSIEQIKNRLREFAAERDWERFHSSKNLAMALIVEAAEQVEHLQWMKEEESTSLTTNKLGEVGQELADIQIYLIRLAGKLDIDLTRAVEVKIALNEKKYPAEKVHGSSMKYTEYRD